MQNLTELHGWTYYEVFQHYIRDRYNIEGEDGHFYNLLLFDFTTQDWYIYKDGYYQLTPIQKIRQLFHICMDLNKIPTNNQKCSHCVQRLEAEYGVKGTWLDNDPYYENVLNGIILIPERQLIAHSPMFHFKYQIPRKFDPEVDPVIPPLFHQALQCIPKKEDRDNFLKFWLIVAHKRHEFEVFLMCYGVRWGGKSSMLNIFAAMFGPHVLGKKPLFIIGERFGMSNIYDKRLNIHADMPIANLTPYTISQLKTITGNDGGIDIEIKGKTPFAYPVQLFLAFGINQLMGFTKEAEKEIESIMRRVVLVEFPKKQAVDAAFKKQLVEPAFLDHLFSWLIITQPMPLFDETDQDEWVAGNKEKWIMNAYPIIRILSERYEKVLNCSIEAYEVVEYVREQLKSEGQIISKDLKSYVTQAFATLDIYPNNKRGANCHYLNVACRLEMIDT